MTSRQRQTRRRIGRGLFLAVLLVFAVCNSAAAAISSPCGPSAPVEKTLSAAPQGPFLDLQDAADIAEIEEAAVHGDGVALETIGFRNPVAGLGAMTAPPIAVHRMPSSRRPAPRLKPPAV